MVLRYLFDLYLPTRLLLLHECTQLTDRYHPDFLSSLFEQRCYIEYSRLQAGSSKRVREKQCKRESICSDEEEGEDNVSESIVEDPTETPGLFILCQKILNFLVEKKDLYSLKAEEYTFLDPYLVREIDDATVFSGKRNKEFKPPVF